MTVDLDTYNFDDYFNALISPVSDRQEMPMMMEKKFKQDNEIKFFPKMENNMPIHQVLMPNVPGNFSGMMMVPVNIHPNMLNNGFIPVNAMTNKNAVSSNSTNAKKRKIKESVSRKNSIATSIESFEEIPASPTKKTKKNAKAPKKKKETPNRKRINYCFEIHRSGCSLNKDAKLYCKVFLKGKLQSEVDLIKGARGKWAYTFYDQRKKKKERRYWPSQSSGPVIEDACDCEKCIPNNCSNSNLAVNNTDEDFSSSPSTEEVEYENQMPSQMGHLSHHQMQQLQQMQQMGQICLPQYVDSHNNPQVVYIMQPHPSYYSNPTLLKSSNDFNGGNQYLKSSNDFNSHQRPWGDYFPSNSSEYSTDGFFVENNFL